MMYFRVSSGILAELRTPSNNLVDEFLASRFICWECAEQTEEFAFAGRVGFGFGFVVDVEEKYAEVAGGAALASFEEGEGAGEEDVSGGGPVGLFGVARGDDAELLVGFVELAFCDSGGGG
jgi:hypothetical protein